MNYNYLFDIVVGVFIIANTVLQYVWFFKTTKH